MYSTIDITVSPPRVEIPRKYNAARDLVDRHLATERAGHLAFIDAAGAYTYAELAERINRAGNALLELGVRMENRVAICLLDSVDFPAVFLGALRIGAVPIPLNTLLTAADYDYVLRDSRAHTLVVNAELYPAFAPILGEQPWLREVVVAGHGDGADRAGGSGRASGAGRADEAGGASGAGAHRLADLVSAAGTSLEPAPTTADDVAFWLYTSGTTGPPKGAMHLHRHLVHTVAGYGLAVLGVEPDDVVFSAAKLFFAYGLGNALTIPLYVGATAVLFPGRPTPDAVMKVLREREPTLFFGVPTLYGNLLADPANDRAVGSPRLRRCISAGEPLPVGVARAWEERFGVAPLDGIGTTEMLHLFLSNRPGDHRYGTTGREPVPGYEVKLVGEDGEAVPPGEIGELCVRGTTAAVAYWNQREKSLRSFHGPWTRTGDKYRRDDDGYYVCAGRTDDMLKVGGIWVSPFEVEGALIDHEDVLEAAVVGEKDENDLVKPKAFVVLTDSGRASPELAEELKRFVKERLAPYKYPRWIEFTSELPKTATGKIKRYELRA